MGSGEVTTPVMFSATVGLQKQTYFEMRYAVMFDDGQTARVHVPGKVANRLPGGVSLLQTVILCGTMKGEKWIEYLM